MNDPVFELWSKYQDIAMHFNELLMQFRLQMVGGLAALGTAVGYLASERAESPRDRYRLLTGASALFAIAWAGAAALDLFYYRELLQGSVDAIVALEKRSWTGHGRRLLLSHAINSRVGAGDSAAFWFYGGIETALVVTGIWAFRRYRSAQEESSSAA